MGFSPLIYNKKNNDNKLLAESWELSTHPAGISRINNESFIHFIKENPQVLGTK